MTTVTPTHFDTQKGLLHVWMKALDVDHVVNSFGNLSADMMNMGFLLLNPARLVIDKYHGFLENMDDKKFVENFVRMEKWIFDSPDLPGEVFSSICQGLLPGQQVDPKQAGGRWEKSGSESSDHATFKYLRQIRPSGSA